MKHITLIIGLLVLGCATLTLEEKVVGAYELKKDGDTYRGVLLENGVVKNYLNGVRDNELFKWTISKEGEIHTFADQDGDIEVFRINEDESITGIATIDKDGKREAYPIEEQVTGKKIKELTLKERAAIKQKVVGTYECKVNGETYREVFLENGVEEFYENGKKVEGELKWKVSNGQIHSVDKVYGDIFVFRINKDGSLTEIATIDKDGQSTGIPKEDQRTFKKIK